MKAGPRMLSRRNLSQNHSAIDYELIDRLIRIVFSQLPRQVAKQIRVRACGLDTIVFIPTIVALVVLRFGDGDFCLATPVAAWDVDRSKLLENVERVLAGDFVEALMGKVRRPTARP